MANALPQAIPEHLPSFITAPGESDWLLTAMAVVLVLAVLGIGVFFFWLHSLPERLVHHKVQFDLVAVLALLSLFTHIHAFWVAALILAFVEFPNVALSDYLHVMKRMAGSLEKMAGSESHDEPAPAASQGPVKDARSRASVDSVGITPSPQVSSEREATRERRHA